ncbi:MAG: hypothetical protein JW841_16035 [Deltaproteobacteria bacterium]|nr:hypothetical protein [Deltaproteobacteria bacterium]
MIISKSSKSYIFINLLFSCFIAVQIVFYGLIFTSCARKQLPDRIHCYTENDCYSGYECLGGICELSVKCKSNADCGTQICNIQKDAESGNCGPCSENADECGTGRRCSNDKCISTTEQCGNDSGCSPPNTVCVAGVCDLGCVNTGCAKDYICNTETGRCGSSTSSSGGGSSSTSIESGLAIGEPCETHGECQSRICWEISGDKKVCSQTCTRQHHCPEGTLCYQLGDGSACIPKAEVSDGARDVAPGGYCEGGLTDQSCASGLCDTDFSTCLETCGNDQDCEGIGQCFSFNIYQVCGDTASTRSKPGEDCTQLGSTDECSNGWCLSGLANKTCAKPCCTPADCRNNDNEDSDNIICKPVKVSRQDWLFHKFCLPPEYQGTKKLGEICETASECQSEICVASPSGVKRCSHTCCTNKDCAAYDWASACRPTFTSDTYGESIIKTLGRNDILLNSIAGAPVCMPRP